MKTSKIISKAMIFLGVAILLGTAGASDLMELSLTESVSQILLGIIFIFCGKAGLNLLKLLSPIKRKKRSKRVVCTGNVKSAA